MHKKDINYRFNCYAKILVFVAVAFLVYGVGLDFYNNHRLTNPILYGNKDSKETLVDIHNDKDKVKESNESVDGKSLDNRVEYYETLYDIDLKNDNLRTSLEKKYGIDIKYGQETFGYKVGGMDTYPIEDSFSINTALSNLSVVLGLYPNGFFKEIESGGIPLTIYLIDEFSVSGVTGVTDSNNHFANIVVAIQYSFEETFFHESYHYIERYILKRGLNFNSWNNFNPVDFMYDRNQDNANHAYSYNRMFSPDAYFVNDYAQTDDSEDRASTFEYMMDSSKASCLNTGKPIWRKAKFMSNTIEATFNTVNASTIEYWERFL